MKNLKFLLKVNATLSDHEENEEIGRHLIVW